MYQNVSTMKSVAKPIVEAYSLCAIQEHFYKVKLKSIHDSVKTGRNINEINENYENILYFFEMLYERDYKDAFHFFTVMNDRCKEVAYKYMNTFHSNLTKTSCKEVEKNFFLFNSIMQAV